ncbi:hypothetical protein [Massilibacteroides vaginae]|nr:hypothetical protein [Massilibacteroides vaginae]
MRCFDRLSMKMGWYEMLRQAQHDRGWDEMHRQAQHDNGNQAFIGWFRW